MALTLLETAESSARTTNEVAVTRRRERVNSEGALMHLKRIKKQFERITLHCLMARWGRQTS